VEIRATELGAVLAVRVSPGARRDGIVGLHGDAVKVTVRQAPERGKANRAVERLLADAVKARPSDVEVVRGETSRDKLVRFNGWKPEELRERLLVLLGDA